MISFRFHLVSLIAVFLALGLGVLTGTTVINRAIVSQLQQQTEQLEQQSAQLREEVNALRAEVERSAEFAEESMAYLVDGSLAQRAVVVVTEEGTDPEAIDGVQEGLSQGRARVVALLALDDSLGTLSEGEREQVAAQLGFESDGDEDDFANDIAATLADRLAFGPRSGQGDPLATLLDGGYLVNTGAPLEEARDVSSDAIVVVGGGAGEDPSRFLVPLVEALARAGAVVGATEAVDAPEPFVEDVLGGAAADEVVTQDNVDELPGQIGLVMALDDRLDGAAAGHYGVKDGATSVIPPAS